MVQRNGADGERRQVAIYCRVSTSDQDNVRQERDLKEYAERAGYEVVAVFRETLSGIRKAKGKRPLESLACKTSPFTSGRCWVRTSDLCRVKAALSR